MSDALVAKLVFCANLHPQMRYTENGKLFAEAAATIAALRADLAAANERAEAERQSRMASNMRESTWQTRAETAEALHAADRKAHEKEIAVWSENYAALEADAAALRAQVRAMELTVWRMRLALRTIATFSLDETPVSHDEALAWVSIMRKLADDAFADNARAALAPSTPDDGATAASRATVHTQTGGEG